jgi:hypothetical protein
MTAGHLYRCLSRLLLLLTTVALATGVSHGARAAPAGQADAVVEEIQRQVSQIRGLDVRTTTPVVTLSRAALVERLSRAINTDQSVREFLTSQMLLEVLGAMKRGFDLRELQLRLLTEQTVAVYDFDARSIYLVADYAAGGDLGADARLVVAHELTHALQDQHFGLKRVLPDDAENSDAATAARALVEGDAMLTMRIWGRQFLRPNEKRTLGDDAIGKDPVLDSAPPLVRGELLFPYDAGWVFAQLLFQDGGYAAIDRAFARPPRSTEQILHPEKYAANEAPVAVELPRLERGLGGSWITRRTDVFGELVLRLLLEPSVGWPVAEAAAAGWGGDAYSILEDADGRRVVAMVTVWDTEGDAAEMYNAFVRSIPAQYQANAQRTITQPSVARWTIPEYQVQALKTDNVVRIIYAPDDLTLNRVEVQLGGTAISPVGPIAPPPPGPGAVPASSPGPSLEGTPPTPSVLPTPGAEPDQTSTPVVPVPGATPGEPGQNVAATPEGQPGEEDEEETPSQPGQHLSPPPPGPSPAPAQPLPPPQGAPPQQDSRSLENLPLGATPPTIQPLPRGTPRPTESAPLTPAEAAPQE